MVADSLFTPSAAFDDQKPGTSGLRKTVKRFQTKHYLQNFVQAVFNAYPALIGGTLVLGGDGRFFNREAMGIILRMAAANGVARVILGQKCLLSTPAASHLVRLRKAQGAIILSASHNPGGPEGDFGIKLNIANGGPAPEIITEAIYQAACNIEGYKITEPQSFPIDKPGEFVVGEMPVEVVDSVADYAELMAQTFDFEAIRELIQSPDFQFRFDAMNAVTGPYAEGIFVDQLGASKQSLMACTPLPDFGRGHPDPNLSYAKELVAALYNNKDPIHFGAASDGDGDRNMVLGHQFFVSPSDAIAVMAANAHLIPAYANGLSGVARSMPTSRALDIVADKLGINSYETPTGWKFFGNLLDSDKITLCGEESFGASSNHIREKDGLWAILFWLNLIAAKQYSVAEILAAHWAEYGRHYYARHDYEGIPKAAADKVISNIRDQLETLKNRVFNGLSITEADEFSYIDPVDGSVSHNQGLRIIFGKQARIVFRLSGTGTQGATLRIYLERYETDPEKLDLATDDALKNLANFAAQVSDVAAITGFKEPSQKV